jgi:hypothetical protein
MEETREWKLKQRLYNMCDRMFSSKRAKRAKEDILYWLLRHPRLYVAGDTLQFYLCDECGHRLPQANFINYIAYALCKDRDSIDEDLEAIRSEVEKSKKRHFENAAGAVRGQ